MLMWLSPHSQKVAADWGRGQEGGRKGVREAEERSDVIEGNSV